MQMLPPPYRPGTLIQSVPSQSPTFDFAAAHAGLLSSAAGDWAGTAGTAAMHTVPLFPSAADAHGRQGIAQVLNRSGQAGVVRIEAVDDTGRRYGPLALFVEANGTARIDSDDLENGNANKGLFGGTGQGVGDWRLVLSSDLDIETLSYVRSWDGVLSSMHDAVLGESTQHRVPIFNPASDWDRESRLRLINPSAESAVVAITGIDSLGLSPGTGVSVTIPAGASLTYTAAELESGRGAGLQGSLGEGIGEWQLIVESQQPLTVMNLLASPTGHLTNLSTVPDNAAHGVHVVPLFPAASDPSGSRGLVRVINRTGTAGDVHIKAFDDTQWDYTPLVLSVGAGEAVQFDSSDLEQGNPARGLAGGTGPGQGDWRLELTSDLDIEVLSYVRAWDGLLTSMHDVAPSEADGTIHRVTMVDPEGHLNRHNRLRLINSGRVSTEVLIAGVDATGASLGEGVTVTIPAEASRTYTAAELAGGAPGLRGLLGGAAGEWQLSVVSEQPIRVMSLFASPTGHLTNLSTAPLRGPMATTPLLPMDTDPTAEETAEDVFRTEVSPVVQARCILCHREGLAADAPLSRLQFSPSTVEDHVALNLAVFEALIAVLAEDEQVEDPVAYILNKVQGVAHGGGVQLAAGTDNFASLERFLGLLGEAVAPVEIEPETLFEGVMMEPARNTLRRAAIVFAGRVPTDAEYVAVEGGSEDALRTAIRGLMTGPGFHEFLVRASNDQLFTDREITDVGVNQDFFVEFANASYRLAEASMVTGDDRSEQDWHQGVHYGAARAPLELIAHVVENDLPYTEILTANYVMANPQAAEAYGAGTAFDDPDNPYEFRPSEIASYYGECEGRVERDDDIGRYISDPGPCKLDWPHAGILNTKVFLQRYPTTATNRNRARSRWTYYHFLGVDIEKSASRTTNPVALADTNNPTMQNPACTVCHSVLDPVAGAFQNYGDEGLFRDQWGGLDSLDRFYKDGGPPVSLDVEADSYNTRETISATMMLSPAGVLVARFANDYWNGDTGEYRRLYMDRLVVRESEHGDPIFEIELEDLTEDNLGDGGCRHGTRATFFAFYGGCQLKFEVNVPVTAPYHVEAVVWADQFGDEFARVEFSEALYRNGDTWYRDMLEPGFDGELVPNADNSLQWLAQRIVADERFAEAAVRFWWPAIMGSEVAEPPEDEADADFEGLLLASNAQATEATRLAQGFRRGFQGREPYNLKDLLVEIALSRWFRAASLEGDDPVRAVALQNGGAKRLLTPEELAHKTAVLTGFEWNRSKPHHWHHPGVVQSWTNTEWGYGLLYGGIDSDGVTDRARDLTSMMAGVAQSHALQSSYPIVMREFFLLPQEDRLLFAGMDTNDSPVTEFSDTFEIADAARFEIEKFRLDGHLKAGSINVSLKFPNDFWDEDLGDRNVRLDRLELRNASGDLIETVELENLEATSDCNRPAGDHFALHCSGSVDAVIEVPADGDYAIEVTAWADQAGDELARLQVAAESDTGRSAGAHRIRSKLVDLYDTLHGIQVTTDSPEVRDAYELFVEVWERKRGEYGDHFLWNDENIRNNWSSDAHFLDGIADDLWREELNEDGNELGWDWDRIGDFFDNIDWSDPQAVARTWTVVLAYLMTDYQYLYL